MHQGPVIQRLRGDDGVIDYAVTLIPVIFLVFLLVQAALYFAARDAAIGSAQQGVDAARVAGASITGGQTAACSYAATVARGILNAPDCTVTGGATVTVTVCGQAARILPVFPLRACAVASGAREHFT